MTLLAWTGRDRSGARRRGTSEASSPDQLVRQLLEQGVVADTVRPVGSGLFSGSLFSGGQVRLDDSQAAEIARDLGRFLKAGLPLVPSLRALARAGGRPDIARYLNDCADLLESGRPLSAGLRSGRGRTAETLAGIVEVGEGAGRLAEALDGAAKSFAIAARFRSQVLGALLYPAMVVLMVLAALAVFVGYVLPSLRPLFEGPGLEPPEAMARLFWIADTAALILPALLLVIGAAALLVGAIRPVRLQARRLMERVLMARRDASLTSLIIHAGVARRLALGLSSGVRAPRAFAAAAKASGAVVIREAGSTATEALQSGTQLSHALDMLPGIPAAFVSLARAGETAGRLAPAVEEAAAFLEQAAQVRAERFVAILVPVVTLVTGAIVGLVVVTVFSGLSSVAGSLLE